MANIKCTGEVKIEKNGKEIISKIDDIQGVPCIEFKTDNENVIKISASDGYCKIDSINGITVNGNNILSMLSEKLNNSEVVFGENQYGKYALLPKGILLCWGSIESGSSGTIDVPLPYYPTRTDYAVGWSVNSSLDTLQSFRGMGAWEKTTTSFKTRRFNTAGKDWLLIGNY